MPTTTPYTNQEWQRIIVSIETNLHIDSTKIYSFDPSTIAHTIDHTLLKLDSSHSHFDALCHEALQEHFASVCVRPEWVKLCVEKLRGSGVRVASVVGFHEGTYDVERKLEDVKLAVEGGAEELDLVVNWGWLKEQE